MRLARFRATDLISPRAGLVAGRSREDKFMPGVEVIDVHSHAMPNVWRRAVAAAIGGDPDHLAVAGVSLPAWSPGLHLEFMERTGIAACVLSQPSGTLMTRGRPARELARRINEEYAGIIADHPGQFGAFATLPFDDIDAALEETAYALDELGLDGVASSTHYDGDYLGDPRYDPLFDELNRRGAVLFAHPTEPPGLDLVSMGLNVSILEFMFDTTRMVINLVLSGNRLRYPDVEVISTHGGGTIPYIAGRVALAEPYFGAGNGRRTLSADEVVAGLAGFHYDLTASTSPAALDAIRHLVPTSQLMLGHDFPMMPAPLAPISLADFEAYEGFSDTEREQIGSGNALKLFPRLARRRSTAQ